VGKSKEETVDLRAPNAYETQWVFQSDKGARCYIWAKYWYDAKKQAQCVLGCENVELLANKDEPRC
jgi:hypothetical protein